MALGLAGRPDVIAYTNPGSPAAEAYRTLRTNLQFSSLDQPIRRLLLTSAGPDEGTSSVVANLAITMAQAQAKVIVVDGDLRRPTQHTLFNLRNTLGLTTLFLPNAFAASLGTFPATTSESAGAAGAAGAGRLPQGTDLPLQQTAVPNLWVLSSGPVPPNPVDLLASRRMDEILEQLCERADVVLVDSPPVVVVADAAVLSAKVDGVLLVVGAGTVKRDIARKAKAQLEAVRARVLGMVVNNVPFDGAEFSDYYEPAAPAE